MHNLKLLKKKITKLPILIIRALVISTILVATFIKVPVQTTLGWMDLGWQYRKPVTVANSGSTATNEDVLITVDTLALVNEGKLQADCDDLRFTDSDENTTLSYWIEGGCNTTSTKIWTRIPSLPTGGKTIYMYYGNPTAVSATLAWSGNVIMFADTACPTGWTRATTLDGKFLYGSATYGTTGGSNSHAHTDATATSSSISTTNIAGSTSAGTNGTTTSHTHTALKATVNSNASVQPPFKDAILCYSTKFLLTQGLVSMFNTDTPTGWTRFSALDGVFPKANTTYGATGGSSTHTHTSTTAFTTGAATGTQATIVPPFSATGGTITTSGGYTIHTFTSDGTFTVTGSGNVEVLLIGGGGSGGGGCTGCTPDFAGGGGGGQFLYSASVAATTSSIVVGAGGAGVISSLGNNGGNSSAFGLLAYGGGRARTNGGSGGGGTLAGGPGSSVAAIGNRGGYGTADAYWSNGGGGGAGGIGGDGGGSDNATPGNGGAGRASSISGASVYYAAGGGGGTYSGNYSSGGTGGGGGGGGTSSNGGNAGGYGCGGGGAGTKASGASIQVKGGNGSSGIVIVRYPTPTISASGTIASNTHTHTSASATVSTDSSLPPYLDMVFAKANTDQYVTENNVIITSALPPLGWNQFTALDNKFARGAATYGVTGGTATHTHSTTVTSGAPSATLTSYGTGANFANSTHTHSATVTSDAVSNLPAYTTVIYAQRKVSKATIVGAENVQNTAPNAPSTLHTEGSDNPTLVSDYTPEFSAIFTDTDGDNTGDYYQIQVNTNSSFTGTTMWDSTQTSLIPAVANGSRSQDITYAGTALQQGNTYYWRMKFWDSNTYQNESNWSATAQFTIDNYNITYNLDDGTNNIDNPAIYTVDTPTITFLNPTKTGYTFGGWYSEAEFVNEVTQITLGSTGHVTLYAKWTINTYNITYNLDGGTNDENNPATYTVITPTISLETPTKTGYTFGGWYTELEFTNVVAQITLGSTGDKTFYAKWAINTYTVSFNGNTNTEGFVPTTITQNYNTTVTVTRNTGSLAKTGYTFNEWNTLANGEGTAYVATNTFNMPASNSTLYAQWAINNYNITYNLDGGTNHVNNPTTYTVVTPTISLGAPTKTGYTFGGWYTEAGFTNVVTQITLGSTGDKTLYAKWAIIPVKTIPQVTTPTEQEPEVVEETQPEEIPQKEVITTEEIAMVQTILLETKDPGKEINQEVGVTITVGESKLDTKGTNTVHVYKDSGIDISIPASTLAGENSNIDDVYAVLGASIVKLTLNTTTEKYNGYLKTGNVTGKQDIDILTIFKDSTSKKSVLGISIDPYGYVYALDQDGNQLRIVTAKVSLYRIIDGKRTLYAVLGQDNPQTTDHEGEYSFMVEPGTYVLVVKADKYKEYDSGEFEVQNTTIEKNIQLTKQPYILIGIIASVSTITLIGIFIILKQRALLLRKNV